MSEQYPDAHYDEDDTCQCPDHRAMRAQRADELAELTGERPAREMLVRQAIGDTRPRRTLRTVITGLPDELITHPPREPISVTFVRIDYTLGIAYYAYLPGN